MERNNKFSARRCLNAAIDALGRSARKALAEEHGLSEPNFSKATQRGPYDIGRLDDLSEPAFGKFLAAYGEERGYVVRGLEPRELEGEMLDLVDRLTRLASLRQVRARPAKADLPAVTGERRRA